jgi:hypothetical protein
MTTPAVRQALREWVLERNSALDPAELREDTPLLSRRLVTSLQVTDLLLFIESLRRRPVGIESLTPGAFRDIDTIARTFFTTEQGPCAQDHSAQDRSARGHSQQSHSEQSHSEQSHGEQGAAA